MVLSPMSELIAIASKGTLYCDVSELFGAVSNSSVVKINDISIFSFCIGFVLTLLIYYYTLVFPKTRISNIIFRCLPALSFVLLAETIILYHKIQLVDGIIEQNGIKYTQIFQGALVISFIYFTIYFLCHAVYWELSHLNLALGFIFVLTFLYFPNIEINIFPKSAPNQYKNLVEVFSSAKGILLAYMLFLITFLGLRDIFKLIFDAFVALIYSLCITCYLSILILAVLFCIFVLSLIIFVIFFIYVTYITFQGRIRFIR